VNLEQQKNCSCVFGLDKNIHCKACAYTMIFIANTPVATVINTIHAWPQEDLAMNNINIPVCG
jgi:hypothetical protein